MHCYTSEWQDQRISRQAFDLGKRLVLTTTSFKNSMEGRKIDEIKIDTLEVGV